MQSSPQNLPLLFFGFLLDTKCNFGCPLYHNFDLIFYSTTIASILSKKTRKNLGRWRWRWFKWGALCSIGECCWPTLLVFIWSTFALKEDEFPTLKNTENTGRFIRLYSGQEWMQCVTVSQNRILHFVSISPPQKQPSFRLFKSCLFDLSIKKDKKLKVQQFTLALQLKSVKTQLGLWSL